MKDYVNSAALQEYTTKLVAKLKTLFPGTPTAAATVADMTDHSKTYVYVGSETGYTAGDWYYWDGSAWTSGGPFQATSIITDTTLAVAGEAADAKATGDAIAAAKTAVLNAMAPAYSTSATYAVGKYVNHDGKIYRCTTAITTAEAWTPGHWTEVPLGTDLADQVGELKTQFNKAVQISNINIYGGELSSGYVPPHTGEFVSGSTTKVTDYLPVIPGKYVVSAHENARLEMYLIAVFDSSKTVIPETVQQSGDGKQRATGYFLIPSNGAFIRVTYLNANVHDTNKLYVESEPNYNPTITERKYLVKDDDSLLPFEEIVNNTDFETLENETNDLMDKIEDTIYYKSANIYDNALTAGYVPPQTGEYVSGTTTKVTDFLEVIPGKYVVSAYNNARLEMYMIALFDSAQNVIPETVQQSGDGKQRATGYFFIPGGCKYIRVTYVNANAHSDNKLWMLDAISYEPTNIFIKSLILDNGDKLPFEEIVNKTELADNFENEFNISHKYYKQKIVAMGDSVTNGQAWFDGVTAYFGIRPVNKGVPGSKVSGSGTNAFWQDARVNDIPTDTKLLLLMGGINDWLSNTPLGDLSLDNVDTDTFYGAVNVLIQKLNTRIPNATIICMGATFGIYPNRTEFDDTEGIYNNLELCSLDYGKALADMCKLNGVKSFVIGHECGWNKNNYSTFIEYDGAYLHPNATGGARMAEVIAENIP